MLPLQILDLIIDYQDKKEKKNLLLIKVLPE